MSTAILSALRAILETHLTIDPAPLDTVSKDLRKFLTKQVKPVQTERDAAVARAEKAEAELAETKIALAAAKAKPARATTGERKAKTKKGRVLGQVLGTNLDDNENVYRTMKDTAGATINWACKYQKATDNFKMADGNCVSISTFASAMAIKLLGDNKSHRAINGWVVCYVIRDKKKVYLKDFRVQADAPAELVAPPAAAGAAAPPPADPDTDSDTDSAVSSGDEPRMHRD
jgi:hypothetical protein